MNHPSDRIGSQPEEINQALRNVSGQVAPAIEEDILIEIDTETRQTRDDSRVLSRFFGMSIFVVGLVSIVPTIYFLAGWASSDDFQPFPRWAYIIAFLGALHILYALYVYSIADYSAVQALSIFLLVVTCLYGFVVAAIMLQDSGGGVVSFLQLPNSLMTRAAIWSGIMFSVSALCCYILGRESIIWRRRANRERFQ